MSGKWVVSSVALLVLLGASPALLSAQVPKVQVNNNYRSALPGTVNYVEGQASLNGRPLSVKQNGSDQVEPNQNLTTANGHAEMLLSPGAYLRTGSNSEVRMVSNGLASPTVEVVRGEAMVEMDGKATDAQITILQHGATAVILKPGLYQFDADQNRIAVFDGKLKVTENGREKELGKGHEALLNRPKFKTEGFDAKASQDDLYRWSSVRSSYLAEASQQVAQNAYYGYGPYWGAGWYWDPWFDMYSWLPGDGFWYSPFGYPFFGVGYVPYAGLYGRYGFRGGYGRYGYRGFAGNAYRGGFVRGGGLARGGGFAGGGFHGGGFGGGGFHGGGGGRR